MIALGVSSVAVCLAFRNFNPCMRNTLKNAIFAYFGLGLFIAPEVYYPVLGWNERPGWNK